MVRLSAAGANGAPISFAIMMWHSPPNCRNSRSWEKAMIDKAPLDIAEARPRAAMTIASTLNWERLGIIYARIALGAAFLSGIASRFGLYGKNVGYGNFANFVRYTAEVNSFMPASTI